MAIPASTNTTPACNERFLFEDNVPSCIKSPFDPKNRGGSSQNPARISSTMARQISFNSLIMLLTNLLDCSRADPRKPSQKKAEGLEQKIQKIMRYAAEVACNRPNRSDCGQQT